MVLALAALLCLASGFALVSLCWPRLAPFATALALRISLAIGFGLAIFSVVFFLTLLFGGSYLILVDLGVFALLLLALFLFRTTVLSNAYVRTAASATTKLEHSEQLSPWFPHTLTAAFATVLCAAFYSALMRTLAHPHGDGWDAFSIWNLHARFLFRGGANWRDGFSSLIPWSHPDYPLLLSAAIAHFWMYLGHDSPAVPAIIGFVFTFATVALLYSALRVLRGRTASMLAAIALLTTPSFIEQGAAQYADVPLSFFILASVALLCLHDCLHDTSSDQQPSLSPGFLALAGLAAGFAAWTKNEGLLFLCAILFARLVIFLCNLLRNKTRSTPLDRMRHIAPLVLGLAPIVFLILYFKHAIAPPGDLFSNRATALQKLHDPARYWIVIQWYLRSVFRFGHWLLIPGILPLIGICFVASRDHARTHKPGFRTSVLALALTLAGYFAIYLITPYDIYWHLRFSLSRLFLQLWPSTIFLLFLGLKGFSGNPSDH